MDHYSDDCETCLERLERERELPNQGNPRLLVDALREVLHDPHTAELNRFLIVLKSMASQPELYMRYDVIDQIPKLAVVCDELDQKASIIDRHLLPIVLESLTDPEGQVRKAGQTSLLVMMEQDMLSQKVVEESVCPFVVDLTDFPLAHGITLMGKLAQFLGKNATIRLFLDKFAQCCKVDKAVLREACAKNFGEICAVIGPEVTTSRMVTLFCDLCEDEDWSVRRACAEVFMLVSCAVPLETRRTELTPRFLQLLSDNDSRTSAMAFQVLGAFICTFDDSQSVAMAYDPCGELIFVGYENSEFRVASQQHLPFLRAMEEAGRGNNFSALPFCRIEATTDADDESGEDDAYNTFRFWKLPVLDLEVALDDAEIQANLASLDSELTSLSEKLDKCSSKDLRDGDDSVISEASTPDSGWNSGANTPLQPQTPLLIRMSNPYMDGRAGKFTSPAQGHNKPPQSIVPQPLLDSFLSMSDPALHGDFAKEYVLYCAYFIPGVASTLRPQNWPWVADLYRNFAQDRQWKVRKAVASSLFSMCEGLGPDTASRDLAPILKALLKDLDEVRIGALDKLASTLQHFNPDVRETFLPLLRDFLLPGSSSDGDRNWRFREKFAGQLAMSCHLFSPCDYPNYFGSPVFSLLQDKVAAVRLKAIELMVIIIMQMNTESELRRGMLDYLLQDFAESTHSAQRVLFAQLCSEIAHQSALPIDEFCETLLPHLLRAADDGIPNVRICAARCIAREMIASGYLKPDHADYEHVSAVLECLKRDSCRDVREAAMFEKFIDHSYLSESVLTTTNTDTSNASESILPSP